MTKLCIDPSPKMRKIPVTDHRFDLRVLAIRVLSLLLGMATMHYGTVIGVEAATDELQVNSLLVEAKRQEEAKHYQKASMLYRKILALRPHDDAVRATLAKVLSWQGQYGEAEALYREVLKRHPHDHDVRLGLARVLSWRQDFVESQAQYEQVLRDEPQRVDALIGLGDVTLWSGHPDRALSYYERAFSITHDVALGDRIEQLKAELARRSGPGASQARPLQGVSSESSVSTSDVLRLMAQGRRSESEGRYHEASTAYREALSLQHDNDEIRAALARIQSWLGNYAEAIELYREILLRHPDDQEIRTALARTLSWHKRFAEAQGLYEEVLRADPANLEAKRGVAEIAHWQGNLSEAVRRYEALVAETHDPELEQRLRDVRSELAVSPRALVETGATSLRIPYRDYVKIGYGHYAYTNNQPDERDGLLEVAKPIGQQTMVLRVEPLNRFGFHDTPVSGELYSPLWQRAWGYLGAQGTINPTFTPNFSAVIELYQGLGVLRSWLAPFEVNVGYRRLRYKLDDIDLLTPGLNIYLPFNLWLTEKVYFVPDTGAVTLASQLTWRPADRVQVFASGSFGTSGERIVASQDFTRVASRTIQWGASVPLSDRFSAEIGGYYEDRGFLYIRRGSNLNLIYHW